MDILKKVSQEAKINLTQQQLVCFKTYKDLLIQWNNKINLTAITDDEGIAIKHFIDSIIPMSKFQDNSSIIDVGSGAGFPTVPLAIMNETLKITALDSLNKRLIFLQNVKEELNLSNISFTHGRAEDFGRDKDYRETFDYATARAVASLNVLAELCLPFVKVGGYFISYKGERWEEELKQSTGAINKLGGEITDTIQYSLPQLHDKRSIIIIKKTSPTPTRFPRKAGVPNKKPLT